MSMKKDEKTYGAVDSRLIGRLIRYAAPYKIIVIMALLSLILGTVCEMIIPVVLQKAIDRDIMPEYYLWKTDLSRESALKTLAENSMESFNPKDLIATGNGLMIFHGSFRKIDSRYRALLELDPTDPWHRFRLDNPEAKMAAERYVIANMLWISGDTAWIRKSDIHTINSKDLTLLRSDNLDSLKTRSVLYLVLLVALLLFSFLQVYLTAWTAQGVMKTIRQKLMGHILHQKLDFHNKSPVGSLVSRLTSDVDTINEFFTSVAGSFLKDISMMAGILITLFLLDIRLAWIATATLPPLLAITLIFRYKARSAYRLVRKGVSNVNAFLSEHISGMSVVQQFVQEKRTQREFRAKNGSLLKAQLGEMYVFATFRPLVNMLSSISVGVIIYFGAGLQHKGVVTLGILIAFINLIQKFFQPVMDIAEKFTILQSAMAGSERVFAVMDDQQHMPDTGTLAPDIIEGSIRFRNVRFAYKQGEPVLKGLDFFVAPGETVAVVGYTGAGKTTIASLLTRLWDIQSGSIEVDGVDISQYRLDSLRSIIQPVQQDVFIFAGSIEDNIRMGADMSATEVRNAAITAQADIFISKLPHGYRTMLTERGQNISAGQRQLIAFARIIAHNPRIIILDEATASIDTETERLIQIGLEKVLNGRTALIIAHRLSTIRHSDNILVLRDGVIAEQGRHDKLLEKKGIYHSLYHLQFKSGA